MLSGSKSAAAAGGRQFWLLRAWGTCICKDASSDAHAVARKNLSRASNTTRSILVRCRFEAIEAMRGGRRRDVKPSEIRTRDIQIRTIPGSPARGTIAPR